MPKLKIQTGEGEVVPGKANAEREQAEQRAQAEHASTSLFKEEKQEPDVGPDYTYSRIRIRKRDEVNVYAAEQDERYAMDKRLRTVIVLCILCLVGFVVICILPTQIFGRAQFNLAIWLSELMAGFQNFIGVFTDPDTMYTTYALTILVTMLAGAAMALSGGIFQGSLKNALASPSTLGVMSGGTIGSIIYSVFVYPNSLTVSYDGSASDLIELYDSMPLGQLILEQFGGFICSFLGCMIIVFLVMSIALIAGRGKVNNVALVVAGQVFTSLISLILSFVRMWLMNHGDSDSAIYLAEAQSTTFTGTYTFTTVAVFAVPLVACMVICFSMASRLSLLAFNDEEARSMGINTARTRNFMVFICTLMTALVVSFCGAVGFVGFMVPHIARRLVGPDFRYLLPTCALIGALLVSVTYYITELNIPYLVNGSAGVLTSVIGCVAFLIIALRGRRSSGGEWL